jgi:cytochrome c556
MKKGLTIAMGLILAVLLGNAARAQFAKPDDAIAYRKAVMSLVGFHFNALGAVVKGEKPFAKDAAAKDAGLVDTLMGLPWEAFKVPGSDQGATRAKREALTDKAGFEKAAGASEAAAAQLAAAAKGGDLDAVKKAFGQAAQGCKACHAAYRK